MPEARRVTVVIPVRVVLKFICDTPRWCSFGR
jgi:hypothetical protein